MFLNQSKWNQQVDSLMELNGWKSREILYIFVTKDDQELVYYTKPKSSICHNPDLVIKHVFVQSLKHNVSGVWIVI